ncbi:MAG: hypothetical protein ACETWM_00990 [Candidatus Lokiarchaeia archaeon]
MKTVYVLCEKCATFNKLKTECEECFTRGYICNNCGNFNQYNQENVLIIN